MTLLGHTFIVYVIGVM